VVSRFLITTPQKNTWKSSEPILFLGEWCKLYKKKEYWDNLDFKTKDYHWNDRDKLYKDYLYLEQLYEKVIISCSDSLNQFHKVNYSTRYWKILIGPWLFHFIQILFDRWQMVKSLEGDSINGTIVLSGLNNSMVPINMMEFIKLYSGDLWNHWIFGEIIKYTGKIPITKVPYIHNDEQNISSLKPNKIKQLVKKFIKKYSFKTQKNKYFFYGSSFSKTKQMTLELSLKQIPSFYDFSENENEEDDNFEKNRSLFDVDFYEVDEFESFLSKFIPSQMPKYYLEGFNDLNSQCKKRYWPTNPKCIITSSAIINSDIFKFWVAEKTEQGSKLVISQHGGHYGVGKWSAGENHEISISDSFLSWGWREKGVHPMSSAKLMSFKYKKLPEKKSDILIALGLTQRYSYWLYSIPVSSQWTEYFDDQTEFIDSLPSNIKDYIKVRLSPSDFDWSHKERLLDKFPSLKFDNTKNSFQLSVSNSKIFVGTYNATTFLETFSANIPTIIFWNPLHSEIRQSAKPYFEILHQVGIMHYSPESAARHLTQVWNNIDEWWNLKETQNARLVFAEQYAKTSSNWKNEWTFFLENL
jgi:putative transferase (TIGR04331 family)